MQEHRTYYCSGSKLILFAHARQTFYNCVAVGALVTNVECRKAYFDILNEINEIHQLLYPHCIESD